MVENNGPGDREGAKPPVRPAESGDGLPAWANRAMGVRKSDESASVPDSQPAGLRAVPGVEDSRPAWARRARQSGSDAGQAPSSSPAPASAPETAVDEVEAPATEPFGAVPLKQDEPPRKGGGVDRRWVAVGVGAAAVVAVAGVFGAIVMQFTGGDDGEAGAEEPLPAAASEQLSSPADEQAIAPASFSCEESREGKTVTGNGAGDTDSVAGSVLAFEDAYYNQRSAKAAVELTGKDSPFRSDAAVKTLQEGIDSVPKTTEYCVEVTTDGDKAAVELIEARPGASEETFVQKFTTSREDDKVVIVDISEEE